MDSGIRTPSQPVHADIMEFRLNEARLELAQLERSDPGNLMVPFLQNYCDLIELFLSEDGDLYEEKKYLRSQRIDLIKKGPEDNPWYMHTLAEVYLQWGVIRLKYGDYLSAAADVNRAFRLLKKNVAQYPDFGPSYKNLAVIKMVVGTIPDKYVWVVKLFSSLDGDVPEGFDDLEKCIKLCKRDGIFIYKEAELMWLEGLIYFMNDLDKAWGYMEKLGLEPGTNELHAFIVANTALKKGDTDMAITILKERKRPVGVYPIHYLDMMLGQGIAVQRQRGSRCVSQKIPASISRCELYQGGLSKAGVERARTRAIRADILLTWILVSSGAVTMSVKTKMLSRKHSGMRHHRQIFFACDCITMVDISTRLPKRFSIV